MEDATTNSIGNYDGDLGQGVPYDKSPRAESGLTGIADQRLTALALRRGWLKGQRFATGATVQDFEQLERPPTALELAVKGAIDGVMCEDQRVVQAAVRNIISMESINQKDDTEKPNANGPTINIGIGVRVISGEGAQPL